MEAFIRSSAWFWSGIAIIAKGLVIVRQSEVMVIERLGSFNRVLESGVNIIIPFIERSP